MALADEVQSLRKHLSGATLYTCANDLPPNLRCYVNGDINEPLGLWFHHPLYVSVFPMLLPGTIQECLRIRQEAADAYLAAGKAEAYIFRFERGWRMEKAIQIAKAGLEAGKAKDKVWCRSFWRTAANVWIDGEADEADPIWTDLIDCGVPGRRDMTLPRDRRTLNQMPDRITVYRGVQTRVASAAKGRAAAGWSWTLSPKTATFFAKRFKRKENTGFMVEAEVARKDVVAYLTGRGEEEILIRPGTEVKVLGMRRVG